ncbi:CREB-binding protein [Caerostris darwini]|uniref:histone acetyltransferase n=1 Tax=Caerostris darwini TaxID=1538125 RepID=A0AAV4VD06_9ARAC|nr:CREB-binding protein [Caerostris darwini]
MQNSKLPAARTAGEQSTSGEHNAVPCSGSAADTATAGAIANSDPAPTVDQEKLRLIQKQLVLLLHAYACRSKDCQAGWASTLCSLPNCATMKHVPSHMKVCKIGKQCTLPHSSQIISQKNCTANDCPVCVSLKKATARRQQAATAQTTQSNKELRLADKQRAYAEPGLKFSTSNDGIGKNTIVQAGHLMSDQVAHSCSSQNLNHIPAFQPDQKNIQQSPLQMEYMLKNNAFLFQNSKTSNVMNENFLSKLADLLNSPNQNNHIQNLMTDKFLPVKDWQLSISTDLRRHLVLKIVQTILPGVDINTLKDPRIGKLVSYAEKVERGMFKNANSKEEYYHFLAEKIYTIEKELENQRQNEKENRLQLQSGNWFRTYFGAPSSKFNIMGNISRFNIIV